MKKWVISTIIASLTLLQASCSAIILRADGPTPVCESSLGTVMYQGTLSDISGVFLYGPLNKGAYNQPISLGGRIGLALLAFPFALFDLPLSFIAESTFFISPSIDSHSEITAQCKSNSNKSKQSETSRAGSSV